MHADCGKHRFGFSIAKKIDNYYKRIDPSACYILSKSLVAKKDPVKDGDDGPKKGK